MYESYVAWRLHSVFYFKIIVGIRGSPNTIRVIFQYHINDIENDIGISTSWFWGIMLLEGYELNARKDIPHACWGSRKPTVSPKPLSRTCTQFHAEHHVDIIPEP